MNYNVNHLTIPVLFCISHSILPHDKKFNWKCELSYKNLEEISEYYFI